VNHLIAHNVVYLSIEDGLGNFIFDGLGDRYLGRVLINPSVNAFWQYWHGDMVVIENLPTEFPRGRDAFWPTGLEKMLVDIMADKLVKESAIESECQRILRKLSNLASSMKARCLDTQNAERRPRESRNPSATAQALSFGLGEEKRNLLATTHPNPPLG